MQDATQKGKPLTEVDRKYLGALIDATGIMLRNYPKLKQFTIDLLQDWNEGLGDCIDDFAYVNNDTPGALSYEWETLLEVMVPDTLDYECVNGLLKIAREWSEAIEPASR